MITNKLLVGRTSKLLVSKTDQSLLVKEHQVGYKLLSGPKLIDEPHIPTKQKL